MYIVEVRFIMPSHPLNQCVVCQCLRIEGKNNTNIFFGLKKQKVNVNLCCKKYFIDIYTIRIQYICTTLYSTKTHTSHFLHIIVQQSTNNSWLVWRHRPVYDSKQRPRKRSRINIIQIYDTIHIHYGYINKYKNMSCEYLTNM